MKKFLLIILVVIMAVFSGCQYPANTVIENYTELEVNKEIINRLKKYGRDIISVEEYSYISEKGKITGTYDTDLANNEVLVFVSKGRPERTSHTNKEIYIDKNAFLYVSAETAEGDRYIKMNPYRGQIFELHNLDFKSALLENDVITDLYDSINEIGTDMIASFHNRIYADGHVIQISENGIYRETFYGNEETKLVDGYCKSLQYCSGRIYYIESNKLYSINIDGTDNKLINKDVTDYLINDEGITILSVYPYTIHVKIQKLNNADAEEILSAKGYYGDYKYSLIGVDGNIVFLSRRDVAKSWIEILEQDGDTLNVLNHRDEWFGFDYRPFKKGDDIYYIANEIYKYNIKDNTDLLIAKCKYAMEIRMAGAP